jgi:hypothetical protein
LDTKMMKMNMRKNTNTKGVLNHLERDRSRNCDQPAARKSDWC